MERLFAIVRKLRERDVAILFITHRLDEVFALTQRVTIMRDGATVFNAPTSTLTTGAIVAKMVGRDLESFYPKADVRPGEIRLSVRGLTRIGVFKDISFDVRAGEIVALAGLVGAGRSEVARAIFGIDPLDAGDVWIGGEKLATGHPASAVRAGLALVPEDRRQQGLALELSIARNASMTVLGRLVRHGLISSASETRLPRIGGRSCVLGRRPRRAGRYAVGRQSTEGRAGQVAGDRPQGVDHRRTHSAASMSAPRPKSMGRWRIWCATAWRY